MLYYFIIILMIIIYYNVHYTCTFSRTINILFSNIGKISHTYRELLIHDFLVFHLLSIISCRRKGCNNFWGNVANGKTSLMRWTDCSALFLVCNYKYQYIFSNAIYRPFAERIPPSMDNVNHSLSTFFWGGIWKI